MYPKEMESKEWVSRLQLQISVKNCWHLLRLHKNVTWTTVFCPSRLIKKRSFNLLLIWSIITGFFVCFYRCSVIYTGKEEDKEDW